jgi:plasmid stability protein
MPSHAITLHLPGTVYDRYRRRAKESHRTVEAELLDIVTTAAPEDDALPADLEAAIAELETLDDGELWREARTRFPVASSDRLEALHHKQRSAGLSEEERDVVARLLRQYERTMLVRARAAELLKNRGHDVSILLTEA